MNTVPRTFAEPQGGPEPWSPSSVSFTINSSLFTGNKISGQDRKTKAQIHPRSGLQTSRLSSWPYVPCGCCFPKPSLGKSAAVPVAPAWTSPLARLNYLAFSKHTLPFPAFLRLLENCTFPPGFGYPTLSSRTFPCDLPHLSCAASQLCAWSGWCASPHCAEVRALWPPLTPQGREHPSVGPAAV